MVALAFVTNDDPIVRTEINHKDGNKSNNHYSNLEWVTRSENNLHAFKLGLRRRLRGILNPNYKHGRYVEACND
ncbi:MAG: HNH endonuclease [Bacillota bacterium]